MKKINTALAERYHQHPALLGWHINNEYGGSQDYAHCFCDICLRGFREWLRKRYNDDLDALNRSWWTSFWAHTYTSWDEIFPNDHSNEAGLLNWNRYQSDLLVDFAQHEIDAVRTFSDHPVTTNYHGPMFFYDHGEMSKRLDFVTYDAYPHINGTDKDRDNHRFVSRISDTVRGFKPNKPWILLESCPGVPQWQSSMRLKRPGVHKLLSMQHVAHGADGIMYFSMACWTRRNGKTAWCGHYAG